MRFRDPAGHTHDDSGVHLPGSVVVFVFHTHPFRRCLRLVFDFRLPLRIVFIQKKAQVICARCKDICPNCSLPAARCDPGLSSFLQKWDNAQQYRPHLLGNLDPKNGTAFQKKVPKTFCRPFYRTVVFVGYGKMNRNAGKTFGHYDRKKKAGER